ncbi:MFS transporter [Hirschia litorea]|uniref:MFS transporter n=1 Tax=Hirschia litorea TaxID=1199156 RepID=A0ABW2IPF2_9PROT
MPIDYRAATTHLNETLAGYRNVLAVVTGLTILQAAMASLAIVVAFNLRDSGLSNSILGMVAASFAGGFLVGTRTSPKEISRIGHIRAYVLFATISVIAGLAFGLGINGVGWAIIQFILGLCCAGLLTAGESWVSDAAPETQRGSILSFYHMVSKLGAIAGPFLISGLASGLPGFMIIAALFAASIIPVTRTNRAQPALSTAEPFGPRRIYKIAPASAIAAFTAGAVNNSIAQLYPIFTASVSGTSDMGFTAQFNAALLAGAMIALWPAGLISDRIDRRYVLSALGFIGGGSAIGLFFAANNQAQNATLIWAFLFGAGSLSYYAVAVAHAADKSKSGQATSMMAGILMIWGFGSVLGPILAGFAMSSPLGAAGLFIFAAIALIALGLSMFTRAVWSDAVAEEDKEPFGVAPATSLAIAELDPRGDDEQLELFPLNPEPHPQ